MSATKATQKKDIVIVGGGIVGASTAYYLSRHPRFSPSTHSITIIEGTSIASAASGKAGGLLALDWHGAPTASISELSFGLHEKLAEEHGGKEKWGYRRLDVVSLQADLSRKVKGNKGGKGVTGHKGLHGWLGKELMEGVRVRELGNTETCAQVHPLYLTQELVRLSNAKVLMAEARSLELNGATNRPKSVGVVDRSGVESTLPADEVVIAAGPWTGELSKKLLGKKIGGRLGVTGSRAHSMVLTTAEGVEVTPHALFTSLTLPDGSSCEPELYPRPDGTVYICGATDDEPLPSSAADVRIDSKAISTLKKQALAISNHLSAETVVKCVEQACYLPLADRGTPLVGKVRGVEGVWIGSGLSCWGITQGPGTGACLAQGILEGKIDVADISMLSP